MFKIHENNNIQKCMLCKELVIILYKIIFTQSVFPILFLRLPVILGMILNVMYNLQLKIND